MIVHHSTFTACFALVLDLRFCQNDNKVKLWMAIFPPFRFKINIDYDAMDTFVRFDRRFTGVFTIIGDNTKVTFPTLAFPQTTA
jgi:hypothetical protein